MKRCTTSYLAFALFLLIALTAPSTRGQQSGSASAAPAQLKIAGLQDRVIVRRDERGIPYIQASNDHDLYFAQGYVTASDRLWQMDVFRRNARGELAEIFGAAYPGRRQTASNDRVCASGGSGSGAGLTSGPQHTRRLRRRRKHLYRLT